MLGRTGRVLRADQDGCRPAGSNTHREAAAYGGRPGPGRRHQVLHLPGGEF